MIKQILAEDELPFVFSYKHFPVCFASAMTINKAQGQTFKHLGLFWGKPVFIHGMLYVGLSCVTKNQI